MILMKDIHTIQYIELYFIIICALANNFQGEYT